MKDRNQLIFDNPLTTELPPAQKVYAFRDLPKETQERLLHLQKTDGDFLKTNEKGRVLARVIIFLLLLNVLGAYISSFKFSPFNGAKALGFSLGFVLIAMWIAYFGRQVFRIFKSPIRNHVYLTPTQLIETNQGTIKYREIKDVVEIVVDEVTNRAGCGGTDYILKLKFGDGYFCKYPFERWWKEHQAEAEEWQEKATLWRDAAVNAFKRGDAEYFVSRDVIQKSAMANIPVSGESFRFLTPDFLFKITILFFAIFVVIKVLMVIKTHVKAP
jgi:hypothetical protein